MAEDEGDALISTKGTTLDGNAIAIGQIDQLLKLEVSDQRFVIT